MVDDILESTELKNGNIYDDSGSSYGGEMIWIMILTLCMMPLKKILEIIYIYINIWISKPTNGAKYILKSNNIVCLSENG